MKDELKFNWRVHRLLEELSDEKWHASIENAQVGVGTVDFCIDQGLIRTRRSNKKRHGDFESYSIHLHITASGKKALAAQIN